jgi:putative acetyltransferase
MLVRIGIEDPRQPELLVMLAESDRYYAALYPAESNHLLDAATLAGSEVTTFLVARVPDRVAGFGAVVRHSAEFGEIKRMYVDPAMRGMKLGQSILAALEDRARAEGLPCLRLETGVKQPEAIALYRSAGYEEIPAFGDYQSDPLSIFMEKRLV